MQPCFPSSCISVETKVCRLLVSNMGDSSIFSNVDVQSGLDQHKFPKYVSRKSHWFLDLPIRLEVLGNHGSGCNDTVLLGQLGLCEGLVYSQYNARFLAFSLHWPCSHQRLMNEWLDIDILLHPRSRQSSFLPTCSAIPGSCLRRRQW